MSADCYDDLGVRKRVNAWDTVSSIGGSRMNADALDAYFRADGVDVPLSLLRRRAGEEIARITGNEAACVTGGASAGLLMAASACMKAGKKSFIIQCGHRNHYDAAIQAAGGQLRQIGIMWASDAWELTGALGERPAALLYFAAKKYAEKGIPLAECARLSHLANVPVIVDAAAQLPPLDGLTAYTNAGADAVLFSGGKAIAGPQSCGFAVGTKGMMRAMEDTMEEQDGICSLISIGRGSIMALLTALEAFCADGCEERLARANDLAARMATRLGAELSPLTANGLPIPRVMLKRGDAPILRDALKARGVEAGLEGEWLALNPWDLTEDEAERVALMLTGECAR